MVVNAPKSGTKLTVVDGNFDDPCSEQHFMEDTARLWHAQSLGAEAACKMYADLHDEQARISESRLDTINILVDELDAKEKELKEAKKKLRQTKKDLGDADIRIGELETVRDFNQTVMGELYDRLDGKDRTIDALTGVNDNLHADLAAAERRITALSEVYYEDTAALRQRVYTLQDRLVDESFMHEQGENRLRQERDDLADVLNLKKELLRFALVEKQKMQRQLEQMQIAMEEYKRAIEQTAEQLCLSEQRRSALAAYIGSKGLPLPSHVLDTESGPVFLGGEIEEENSEAATETVPLAVAA